jgi:hypothetical protein
MCHGENGTPATEAQRQQAAAENRAGAAAAGQARGAAVSWSRRVTEHSDALTLDRGVFTLA